MKPEMKRQTAVEMSDTYTPLDMPQLHSSGGRYFRFVRATCAGVFRLYFRLKFHGLENIPSQGPYILAPNHQSYLDPFWVSVPFRYPLRYMTWDRFIYMPVIGHFIRTLGAFPVKLEKGDRAALRHALEHLKNGGTLMIFPEGGRTRTGEVMPFKPGVIRLAYDANVPIVPVSIVGGYQAYNPHHWLPRPRQVHIYFHPSITLPRVTDKEELKQMLVSETARLQATVESQMHKQ